jgi:hypothetical protein
VARRREKQETVTARSKRWRSQNPIRYKSMKLKHKYGISYEDKQRMLAEQNGQCRICGTTDPGQGGWNVDHREPKVVRSLLCRFCNPGLGQFRDDPRLLRLAADYLEMMALLY